METEKQKEMETEKLKEIEWYGMLEKPQPCKMKVFGDVAVGKNVSIKEHALLEGIYVELRQHAKMQTGKAHHAESSYSTI